MRYVTNNGGLVNGGIGTTDISHFDSQSVSNGFMGDYHELWRWNGVWNNPWMGELVNPPNNPTYVLDLYFTWIK